MIKVCQRPELIEQLRHGLTFATDEYVNDVMLTKYSLYEYLTPCDADNTNILQSTINRWREEANKLYETTMFEYDPIENYNMVEHSYDLRTPDLTDKTSYNSDNLIQNTGYNVPRTLETVGKNINEGYDSLTHTGTETNKHDLTRKGNIGTTTTQQMIEAERKIIIDVVAWYVDKFADCFNISLQIDDYCCFPCDFPKPQESSSSESEDIAKLKQDVIDLQAEDANIKNEINDIDNDIISIGNDITDLQNNKAPLMFKAIEGNIITVPDSANAPIIKVVVTMSATQEEGTPTPIDPKMITGTPNISIQVDKDGTSQYYQTTWSTPPGTVYGGILDIDAGTLTATHEAVDMGSLTWTQTTWSGDGKYVYYCSTLPREYSNNQISMCELYRFEGNGTSTSIQNRILEDGNDLCYMFRSNSAIAYIRDDSCTDASAFTTAVTGYKIWYKLATPVVYTVTTVRPNTELNGCTISLANTGDCSLTGIYVTETYQPLISLLSY